MTTNWKKTFAVIYSGQAFSILGSSAVQFAIIWWLTVKTESAITLTIASIVAFLPNLLIGPFAGVWIDRYNRRTVMMLADGFVALSSVILALSFLASDAPPIWLIYTILFMRGLGGTFHGPAMQAAVPLLVPQDMLTKAGGWGNLVNSFSNMLGPVLGAALMGIWPIAGIMLIDIFGAVFAIVCLLFVRIPDVPKSGEKTHIMTDMKQGFRALWDNKPLVSLFVPVFLVNMIFAPLGALYPLMVRTHFMGTAWHNSIVELAFAGGMLVSSALLGIWGGLRNRFLMVSLSVAGLGIMSTIGGLLPPSAFVLFSGGCLLMGMCGPFANVPVMAYTQETIAPEMMGKVMSLMFTSTTLAMPLGLAVAGPVSEAIGVAQWFVWSGVALIGVSVLCRLITRRHDQAAMRPEKAADPANEAAH